MSNDEESPLSEGTLSVIECLYWFFYTGTVVASLWYPTIAVVVLFLQWFLAAGAEVIGLLKNDK